MTYRHRSRPAIGGTVLFNGQSSYGMEQLRSSLGLPPPVQHADYIVSRVLSFREAEDVLRDATEEMDARLPSGTGVVYAVCSCEGNTLVSQEECYSV